MMRMMYSSIPTTSGYTGLGPIHPKFSTTCLESLYSSMSEYSNIQPTPVTIKQFLDLSKTTPTPAAGIVTSKFLVREVLIRVSRIVSLIDGLEDEAVRNLHQIQQVKHWYVETFHDLSTLLPHIQYCVDGDSEFWVQEVSQTAKRILNRHASVVLTVASGVLALKSNGVDVRQEAIQSFLHDLFLSRIGTRELLHSFREVYDADSSNVGPQDKGTFDDNLDLKSLVEEAAVNASLLMMRDYADAPQVNIVTPQRNIDSITLQYIPSHLYHIVFELLKNSMRATVECHQDEDVLPPIEVILVRAKEDVTIKISDKGCGIPRSEQDNLFQYSYTTAATPILDLEQDMNSAPLAGFGYGLSLARIYAEYFGGSLSLVSVEGYGTDAYVYLRSLPTAAKETLI